MSTRGLASDIARQLSRRGAIPETDYSMNPHKSLGESTPVTWASPRNYQFNAGQTGARLDFGVRSSDMTTQFRPNAHWQNFKSTLAESTKGLGKALNTAVDEYGVAQQAAQVAARTQQRVQGITDATQGTPATQERNLRNQALRDIITEKRARQQRDADLAEVGITNLRPMGTPTATTTATPTGPASSVSGKQQLDDFKARRAQENAQRVADTQAAAAADEGARQQRLQQERQQRASTATPVRQTTATPVARTTATTGSSQTVRPGMTLDEFKAARAAENAARAGGSASAPSEPSATTPPKRRKRKGDPNPGQMELDFDNAPAIPSGNLSDITGTSQSLSGEQAPAPRPRKGKKSK